MLPRPLLQQAPLQETTWLHQVLKPHTDPYDVLVWQLVGRKAWRAVE